MLGAFHWHTCLRAAPALLATLVAGTVPAYGGRGPVTATASVSVPQLASGQSSEVTVTIEIADGWHINAADPGLAFLIPTSLSFELPAGVRASALRFPEPETRRLKVAGDQPLRLYHGTVRIGATISYTGGSPVAGESLALLKYQACNDTLCLRPASIKLPLALTFGGHVDAAGDRQLAGGTSVRPIGKDGCNLASVTFYSWCSPCAGRSHFC